MEKVIVKLAYTRETKGKWVYEPELNVHFIGTIYLHKATYKSRPADELKLTLEVA